MEVKSSQVFLKDLRLEAKYYSSKIFLDKEFLFAGEILESSNYNSIYGLNSKGLGYPVLRMNEFETLFTGSPSQHSEKFSENDIEIHRLKKDDILICRTNGNPDLIGKSALVAKDYPYVYESHLFKVRANRHIINSATLSVYLNTKYGRSEIDRLSMQGNQANFSLSKFKEIRVPKLSIEFSNNIEENIYLSFEKLQQSKTLYKQAENLLLKELDLLDFEPSSEKVAIKTFSESFGESGRLDSEYYQVKYDEIVEKIKSYRGGHEKLSNILISINTGEYSEEYYIKTEKLSFYIRSTNINNGLVQKDEKHYVDKNNFTKFVKEGDIVTARVGTLGVFGTIDKNLDDSIYSDNVLCFRLPDTLNPYVYTLFLNSKYNKLLIDRLSRGSVQQRLNQETLKDLFIPIIDNTIQIKIEEKIKESFKLKEESKALLDLAKRAVETAIEEGEDVAMEMMG